MLPKTLQIYRLTEPFNPTRTEFTEALEKYPFKQVTAHDEFSQGFIPPVGNDIIFAQDHNIMFCLKCEYKVIPASSINEELQKRISEIEEKEVRWVPQKERSLLKDEIIFEMLPRVFSQSSKIYGWLDSKNGWLIIDASSPKKAEDVLTLLRKALGSLPVIPLVAKISLQTSLVMTNWLNGCSHKNFKIGDQCELKSAEEGGSIARFKNTYLKSEEVKKHLDMGMQVQSIALSWQDKISFVLNHELQIKRIKFLDIVTEKIIESESETQIDAFSADFIISSSEIIFLLDDLVNAFGGQQA